MITDHAALGFTLSLGLDHIRVPRNLAPKHGQRAQKCSATNSVSCLFPRKRNTIKMHIAKPGCNFTHQRQPAIYRFRGTDLKSRTYLRHQERSVGLPLSLLQGESPGRTAAQRHAHVIPDAHVCAPARQPQLHRALTELSPRQEAPPPPPLDNPHHPGSAPAVETSRRTDTPAHSCCAVMWRPGQHSREKAELRHH